MKDVSKVFERELGITFIIVWGMQVDTSTKLLCIKRGPVRSRVILLFSRALQQYWKVTRGAFIKRLMFR